MLFISISIDLFTDFSIGGNVATVSSSFAQHTMPDFLSAL
jgi:hypothetical protein